MIVVVNDANILIDLVKLQMLPFFFALELEFHTTSFILEELYEEQQTQVKPFIENGTLKVNEFNEEELIEIALLEMEKRVLSPQDCSALFCAQKLNGKLISSDKNLRQFAKSKEVEVHGHFWVFDQLVENQLINGGMACEKMTELCEVINPRLNLPKVECEKRMTAWAQLN
jgi:hypothetical protein